MQQTTEEKVRALVQNARHMNSLMIQNADRPTKQTKLRHMRVELMAVARMLKGLK